MTPSRKSEESAGVRLASSSTTNATRDALITSHLGLAHFLARRFSDRGESHEELVQVASVGLVQAADRFNPSLGVEFSTFATSTILGELKHHFRDRGWALRTPRQIQEHYLEVTAAASELTHELKRTPSVNEVAAACRLTSEDVLVAMEAGQSYRVASLDAPWTESESVGDQVMGTEDAIDVMEQRALLLAALERLGPRDQQLLRLRFVDELSQSEIADRMGMSQMHVSRLLRRALELLRAALADE
ncbi:MAG TPA: SigB/SigF/SigG family RNA polymerase sigma factor [Acidimicrobiales bacterium]|jgi:RNA polymerase sigma-B factor|nr:SigB/SigF/SigG family RNA polymerase sigma factor [Acidimicrobiales bacterium]